MVMGVCVAAAHQKHGCFMRMVALALPSPDTALTAQRASDHPCATPE